MTVLRTKSPAALVLGLGLAGSLCLGVVGCGGKGEGVDDAVVTTAPGETTTATTSTAATTTAATNKPAGGSEAATPANPAEAAPVKAEGWGTLKGRITFEGSPPDPKTLVAKGASEKDVKDASTCAKETIQAENLVVNKDNKGVRFALVYIPKPTAVNEEAKSAASSASIEFDQQHCTFEPHVLAVMKGAKILLKSSDPVNHNIDAKLKSNPTYNQLLAPNAKLEYPPRSAERMPQPVICDIHPWMKAWWLILDNPYFAVTDKDGNFEIKNVPAGTQHVVVWQEATQFLTSPSGEKINIKADGETTKDFAISADKVRSE